MLERRMYILEYSLFFCLAAPTVSRQRYPTQERAGISCSVGRAALCGNDTSTHPSIARK